MKISYAITVCNEEVEIERLVTFLLKHKELQDEIVITYDTKNGSKEVKDFLFNHDGKNIELFDILSPRLRWPIGEQTSSK